MQWLITQQVLVMNYTTWKLVDGDDWGWNLSPREVRIDIFPSCNDTRFLLGLLAEILLGTELCARSTQACSWGLLISSKQRERGWLLPEDGLCPQVCIVDYLHCTVRGFLVLLCLLPVPFARMMPESQCGQFHGCESHLFSANANVLMQVNKSQSTENSGDLEP